MDTLRVNIEYRKAPDPHWKDNERRAEHVIDRMQLRGIGINSIKDAVRFGAKRLRDDGSVLSEYRWYTVIYREFNLGTFRKIYPITVLLEHE